MIIKETLELNVAVNDGFYGEKQTHTKGETHSHGIYVYQSLEDFANQEIDCIKQLIDSELQENASKLRLTIILESL
jgi:hypothetical protein